MPHLFRLACLAACVILLAWASARPDSTVLDARDWENQGTPAGGIQPLKQSLRDISSRCKWSYTPAFRGFANASLQWFASIEKWAAFDGVDLIPENRHLGFVIPQHNALPMREAGIQAGKCELNSGDESGTRWSIARMGPFNSTGGYDWWQFSWDDVGDFSTKFQNHSDGIFLLATFSGAVDATSGDVLNFPPIHVHHVHVNPNLAPHRWRWRDALGCVLGAHDDVRCSNPYRVVFEQHGDYVCTDDEGGVACLLEPPPHGFGKHIEHGRKLSINGELNDARASGSPPLDWWYEVAVQWRPVSRDTENTESLSIHYIASPGRTDFNDQSTMVHTFLAPTDVDSFIWYVGETWDDGELLRAKMHTHNTVFDESFFFVGVTSEDLGLSDSRFWPRGGRAFDVVYTQRDAGFQDNAALREYILKRFRDAAASASKACEDKGSSCAAPRMICHGATTTARVDSYDYDRRARTRCVPWKLVHGEPFLVLGFNRPAATAPGPHQPTTPAFLPGHLHWIIHYKSATSMQLSSQYTFAIYTQEPSMAIGLDRPSVVFDGSATWFVAMAVSGGAPTRLAYRIAVVMLTLFILLIVVCVGCVARKVARKARGCFSSAVSVDVGAELPIHADECPRFAI